MDESTDIFNCIQFIAIVIYDSMIQKIIGEDILFCIPLEPNTTGEKYLSTNKYDIN